MTDRADAVVTLRLPGRPSYIRLARLVGAGLGNDLEFDIERLDDVRLAIGEACSLLVQSGAAEMELAYTTANGLLEVTAGGSPPDGTVVEPDGELIELADQILAVACTEHRISRGGGPLSFWLAFDVGHGR